MKRVFVILIALSGLFAGIPIRTYAAPDIEIWPSYGGDFEVFNVEGGFGPSDTRKVWIKNVGTSDLTITAISSPGAPYSLVSPPVTPFTITPGAERDINILFSPTTQNTYNSKVIISSNDADESNLDIPLKGRADEDTVTISPGDFFTGEIKVIGDTDGFNFYGKKDDVVSITTGKQKDYSGTFYPRWELYAPEGSLLKSITGGGSATATLPATGAYTIVIGDGEGGGGYGFNNQTGQYGLSIQGISASSTSGIYIYPGQNLTDEIKANGDTNAFYFNAVQGDTVSITTGKQKDYSGTFYPRWELYAPDGSLLKSITGGGSATATLPATGAYTIVVGDGEGGGGYGFNNQTGQYGLSLQCIGCTTTCEPESIAAFPSKLTLNVNESGDVVVTVTGKGGCPVEGETVTAMINKFGRKRITVSPTSATTNADGEATFTIIAKNKAGNATVTFKDGILKTTVKVKVVK